MAEANKTLISRAEVDSVINPTAKWVALVIDGQTVELGNTGWRDLSGTLQNVTAPAAGQLVAIRAGNTVTVKVAVTPIGAGQVQISKAANPLPSSFRPAVTLYTPGRGGTIGIAAGGTVYVFPDGTGSKIDATLTFATDAVRPGTLPGVALGEPVVI